MGKVSDGQYFDNLKQNPRKLGEELKTHIEGHLWSVYQMPEYIIMAQTLMLDRDNINEFPDPLQRYNHIIKKIDKQKRLSDLDTVCMSVLQLTLQYYTRMKN